MELWAFVGDVSITPRCVRISHADFSKSFTGQGSTPLPLTQGCGGVCVLADTGISAGLSQPVEIVPVIPSDESPLFEFPQECTERSSYPMWEVSGSLIPSNQRSPCFAVAQPDQPLQWEDCVLLRQDQ